MLPSDVDVGAPGVNALRAAKRKPASAGDPATITHHFVVPAPCPQRSLTQYHSDTSELAEPFLT